MDSTFNIQSLKGGLVVSCQAYPGEALFGSEIMARFALAAKEGGAVAIRANSPADISAIKQAVDLPLIGLWKKHYADSEVYITPTLSDVAEVAEAGSTIVALDATRRNRPNGERLEDIVDRFKAKYGHLLLMADVSTVEEGVYAAEIGFDMVSSTLSGYTDYSPQREQPDIALVRRLAERLTIPVFAEGRIQTPEQAGECLNNGAFAVVVGTAITRPHLVTKQFVDKMALADNSNPNKV